MSSVSDIDALFLWVDGDAPNWRQEMLKHQAEVRSNFVAAAGKQRYRTLNSFEPCVRSTLKNLPWLRDFYFVTYRQVPPFIEALRKEYPQHKFIVVDHAELMPPEAIPVFQNYAVTPYLDKIKGLSEYFLNIDDDMFFNSPISPDYYIADDGKILAQYTTELLPNLSMKRLLNVKNISRRFKFYLKFLWHATGELSKKSDPIPLWKHFRDSNRRALERHFNPPFYDMPHFPVMCRKSDVARVRLMWPDLVKETTMQKFRSPPVIGALELAFHIGLKEGRVCFAPQHDNYYLPLLDNHPDIQPLLEEALMHKIICINDVLGDEEDENFQLIQKQLDKFYQRLLA